MQKCDVSDDNKVALKAKKSCKAAVGKCKNAAVAAVEGIDTCKEEKYKNGDPRCEMDKFDDMMRLLKNKEASADDKV